MICAAISQKPSRFLPPRAREPLAPTCWSVPRRGGSLEKSQGWHMSSGAGIVQHCIYEALKKWWGYHNSWMVYSGTSDFSVDDLGVPLFQETSIYYTVYTYTCAYAYVYLSGWITRPRTSEIWGTTPIIEGGIQTRCIQCVVDYIVNVTPLHNGMEQIF